MTLTGGSSHAALNGDLDLYTDYVARGLTYNDEQAALQGRIEYDSVWGPYVGTSFNRRTTVADTRSAEFDFYAGSLFHVADGSIDVGVFYWRFPGSRLAGSDNRYDTREAYAGLNYRLVGIKYWYELSNYFGLDNRSAPVNYFLPAQGSSRGSHYTEANLTLPLKHRFALTLHAGRQVIRRYEQLAYTDWRVGVEREIGRGFLLGVARSDTTGDTVAYTDSRALNTARGKWVGYLRWAFP